MKKILITGGSGLVGGHLVQLARAKWDVFATFYRHPFSFSGVHAVSMDLTRPDDVHRVVEKITPDVIIHCGALSDLDLCEKEPELCYRINAEATGILAELSSDMDCRLIYTSTDMVFDGQKGFYSESDKTRPINLYGKAKQDGEERIKDSCPQYVIARVALVYGRPVIRGNSFSEKILNRIQNGKTVFLFEDQYRSPILVANLAQALLELVELPFVGTLHLGGKDRVDRYTFGLKLAELKQIPTSLIVPSRMQDVETAAPRPLDVSFDISKTQHLLKTKLLGYHEGLYQI
ncbi:SDR family oxidoreductase [bacterium]|nr:SDR family oxidoreductase [bacterium]